MIDSFSDWLDWMVLNTAFIDVMYGLAIGCTAAALYSGIVYRAGIRRGQEMLRQQAYYEGYRNGYKDAQQCQGLSSLSGKGVFLGREK